MDFASPEKSASVCTTLGNHQPSLRQPAKRLWTGNNIGNCATLHNFRQPATCVKRLWTANNNAGSRNVCDGCWCCSVLAWWSLYTYPWSTKGIIWSSKAPCCGSIMCSYSIWQNCLWGTVWFFIGWIQVREESSQQAIFRFSTFLTLSFIWNGVANTCCFF